MSYELLDLSRGSDGIVRATVRHEDGLTVVREVASVEIEAQVHRGGESEHLGVVAATYTNPATELKARFAGLGTVEVPCE